MPTPWMSNQWIINAVEHVGGDARRPLAGSDMIKAAAASLPSATENTGKCAWITDLQIAAVSNGIAWLRLDSGEAVT